MKGLFFEIVNPTNFPLFDHPYDEKAIALCHEMLQGSYPSTNKLSSGRIIMALWARDAHEETFMNRFRDIVAGYFAVTEVQAGDYYDHVRDSVKPKMSDLVKVGELASIELPYDLAGLVMRKLMSRNVPCHRTALFSGQPVKVLVPANRSGALCEVVDSVN